jgi:ATP synthase protein I
MKKEDKETFKQAVMASTIGFQVAFSPFIGVFIGYLLDWKFNTYPYLTVIWLLIGVDASGVNYYRFAKQQRDEDKGQKK